MANGLMDPLDVVSYSPEANQWLQAVLGGDFLGANPYIDQLIKQMEADAMRQYSEAILPTATARLNQSGAYGTALGKQAQANTARDFAQSLAGQTAGVRYEDYGAERDRMMQALGIYSGQEDQTRGLLSNMRLGTEQAQTSLEQSRIAAAAQRAAANAAAGASRYGADRSFAAARLGAQSDFWRDAFSRSGLMRGYTGGPQQGASFGTPPMVPQGGVSGGPAGGFVPYKGGGDPWNSPGAWG